MALKAVLDSIDGVDEAIAALYKPNNDGKYILDLDGLPPGAVEKTRLDEFRNKNTDLLKEKDELAAQIEGNKEKLQRLAELEEKEQKIADQELIDAGKVDELVEQKVARRVANLERDHQSQIRAKDEIIENGKTALSDVNTKYRNLVIEQNVNHAISEVGAVRGGALMDVMSRARGTFVVRDDGDLVAMDGDQPIYGKTADKLMTMTEWLKGLTETAPHLFEESKGAGGGNKPRDKDIKNIRSIDASDMIGFGKKDNLERIAKGEITVNG